MSIEGTVVSVNVGRPRELEIKGRRRSTGIFKEPQQGRVPIVGVTVGDDVQMDRKYHGGPFKAVYAYALEDYEWWQEQLERDLPAGIFGENLTIRGIDISRAVIGERWRVGTATVEITDPRIPCSTLQARMGIPGFVKTFANARRFGAYFSIVAEGTVAAGDRVVVLDRPDHHVTIERLGAAQLGAGAEEALAIFDALGRPERRRAWIDKVRRSAG